MPYGQMPLGGYSRSVSHTATLTNHTITDSVVGAVVDAQFYCDNTGHAGYVTIYSGSGIFSGEYNPSASGSLYDIRWTNVSGAPTGGSATGTWLNLGSTRGWDISRATPGTSTCTGTVEIRDASTLTVLATATITLTVTYS